MIPRCAIQSDGSLNLTSTEDAGNVFVGGILVNPDGAIRASVDAPEVFNSGFGLRHSGELCIAEGGTIATYVQGLPVTSDGQLVVQSGTPGETDLFHNGICVNGLGVFAIGDVGGTLWVDDDTWDDSEVWGQN